MIANELITPTLLNRAEFLESGDYALIVADERNTDFIIALAQAERYCLASDEEQRKYYNANIYASWLGLYKEDLIGAAIIHKILIPQINQYVFTFDAYEVPTKNRSSSVEFGKLIMVWADKKEINPLWTAHDIRNRAATIACLKLGFKKIVEVQDKIVMRRQYGHW
jgi:hypothetical protein